MTTECGSIGVHLLGSTGMMMRSSGIYITTKSVVGYMSGSGTEMESKQRGAVDGSELFSLLGKAHALAVLREILLGDSPSVRFGELQEALDISPNTLSRRLDELVEVGFLERRQYDEIPPRVEYEATELLEELEPAFRELESWMANHGSERLECPE